jgi:hypothetical protein
MPRRVKASIVTDQYKRYPDYTDAYSVDVTTSSEKEHKALVAVLRHIIDTPLSRNVFTDDLVSAIAACRAAVTPPKRAKKNAAT